MELKPCPFCGKTVAFVGNIAEIEHIDEGDPFFEDALKRFTVVCNYTAGGCGATNGFWHKTVESAMEAWNRRANDV